MNTNAVNEFIAKSAYHDWFLTQELKFSLPYLNIHRHFKGISAFYEFVSQQLEGWNKLGLQVPNELMKSKNFFLRLFQQVEELFKSDIQSQGHLQNIWQHSIDFIANNIPRETPFLYDIPETDFLIKLSQKFPEGFIGGFKYFNGNINDIFNNKNKFTGFLMAYEFSHKDRSEIVLRRESEKVSLNKLRESSKNYLNESEDHLNTYFKRTKDNYDAHLKSIDDDNSSQKKAYNEWYENTQDVFNTFNTESAKKIKELESAYEEKLRLQKPADYWAKRAIELKKEGWSTLRWLVGLVLFASITLYYLLWQTPEGMLKAFFEGDTSTALRWSIVFVTFISFLFFGVRALTKVTFSTFHLARDAEERERLTYVYLAMIKDAVMDKEDRHLIMQSLFSRADTGLLKEDSSPTMPGAGSLFDKFK